ncbi:MAG: DUF6055 domain-containing protein [Bacteroidaceae bacterium]|jgi:hypothetical protein
MKRNLQNHRHFFQLVAALFTVIAAAFGQPQGIYAQKQIYEPYSMRDALASEDGQWSYERSRESENFIIFWEPGFGSDPATAPAPYTVDVDEVLRVADAAFDLYADTLGFVQRGASKTDTYKMIIRLYYQTEWLATGSGEDDMIGILNINPSTVQPAGHTVAHEVGHCFQYQTHCDLNDPQRGFNYGFGSGGSGGNCWWEQCAQWQAFCLYPDIIFTDYRFSEYLENHHKNILHETPRYANYFIQWCWTNKWGKDFIGRMWREALYLEDPVDAYKRMNGNMSQEEFNNDMYEFNAQLATWDIPFLRERGENYINARAQCSMIREDSGYYRISPEECPEYYGYNVIKLNVPEEGETVKACFEWIQPDGTTYRRLNALNSELRYGFVALCEDGTRQYSDMGKATYLSRKDTLEFACPAGCERLMLVVSGGARNHVHHAWDDNDNNDEQLPYQVKFEGTDLFGEYNNPDGEPHSVELTTEVSMPVLSGYGYVVVQPDVQAVCEAFCMSLSEISQGLDDGDIAFVAVQPNGTEYEPSTANGYGHWFNRTGSVCWYSYTSSYIFSELRDPASLNFYIGQNNPSLCNPGDEVTIRQRMKRTIDGTTYNVTYIFNVSITYPTAIEEVAADAVPLSPFQAEWEGSRITLPRTCKSVVLYGLNGTPLAQEFDTDGLDMANFPTGIYLLQADGTTIKIFKQ